MVAETVMIYYTLWRLKKTLHFHQNEAQLLQRYQNQFISGTINET